MDIKVAIVRGLELRFHSLDTLSVPAITLIYKQDAYLVDKAPIFVALPTPYAGFRLAHG